MNNRALLANLSAGTIIGLGAVIWAYSLSALIFAGELSVYVPHGANLFLAGTILLVVVMALTSSYPGTIGDPDEIAGVILSLIATTVLASSGDIGPDGAFATVVVVIVISTLVSGGFFWALGHFRCGDLIRYVPFPVIGGVIVVMGWLLVEGGVVVITGLEEMPADLMALLAPEHLYKLGLGGGFALLMLVGIRIWDHPLVLPVLFGLCIVGFHVGSRHLGYSVEELQALGWLLGPFPSMDSWQLVQFSHFTSADPGLIVQAIPDIVGLVLLCTLNLLLGATAMEVVVRKDVDLNVELKSAGVGNMVASLVGGVTGSHSVEDPVIARELGASGRMLGLTNAFVCLVALLFGTALLTVVPVFALGGFILFIGLVLIGEWLYDGWFRLSRPDYLVIVLCLLVSIYFGYLEGIAFGVIAGVVIFVVEYSRIEAVKSAVSGAVMHSNVERDRQSTERLTARGDRIHVLQLQGFIFFGTAHRVYHQIVRRVADAERPALSYVIVDFKSVSGVDSSATLSFTKARQLAADGGFVLVLANLTEEIRTILDKAELLDEESADLVVFADLDRALEWCEDQVLADSGEVDGSAQWTLEDRLRESGVGADAISKLLAYLHPQDLAAGETLVRQGEPSRDMYFVETGRVAIQLDLPDGSQLRVRSMGPGTIVGEVALYLRQPRSASVVAEEDTRVYALTADALEKMKATDSDLHSTFSEMIIRLLAGRLVESNRLMSALAS